MKISKKKMLAYYKQWTQSNGVDLDSAYIKPSQAKRKAWNDIVFGEMFNGGYDFRVIAHNTFVFTVGYIRKHKDRYYFIVVTHKNVFSMRFCDMFS